MLYLTGVLQEGCAAIVRNVSGTARLTLFVPDPDLTVDAWDGKPITATAGEEVFGADDVRPMSSLPRVLRSLRASGTRFYTEDSVRQSLAQSRARVREDLGRAEPLPYMTHALRWKKSDAELELLRQVASGTCEAFEEAIAHSLREGATEGSVASTVEHGCRLRGADRMAYPSVSAVGESINVIHYSRWDRRVTHAPGELFGMDAGCERAGLCSDITRAWPTSGEFSSAARDFYEEILDVHKQCVAAATEGNTLDDMQRKALELLAGSLRRLGVKGDVRHFFPHNVGHFLGMDVHDCKWVSNGTPMVGGVVLTCEPALYLPHMPEVPKELRGLGTRIEDMLVVRPGGAPPEVLSGALPTEVADIETMLARMR